jgi:hypothetical protein
MIFKNIKKLGGSKMQKIVILLFTLISCSTTKDIDENMRFFDLKKLLVAYGYTDGEYIPDMGNWTVEETLFSKFLFPTETNEQNIKIINEEMPSTKLGALRLCSFILFRSAIKPQYIEVKKNFIYTIIKYIKTENTIEFGRNQKLTIEGIELNWDEINSFYLQALTRKINEDTNEIGLNSRIINKMKPVLIVYFSKPSEESWLNLKEIYLSYKDEVVFIDFIKLFNYDLFKLFEAKEIPKFE